MAAVHRAPVPPPKPPTPKGETGKGSIVI